MRIKEISSGKAVLMNSNKLKGVIIYLVIIFLLIFGLVSVLNMASNSSRTTVTYSGVISEFDDLNVAQYQLDLGSGALTYKLISTQCRMSAFSSTISIPDIPPTEKRRTTA